MNNYISSPHVYDNYKYADFFINKKTGYYYNGSNLTFLLSHALFSSFEVDSGSRLLLKTIVPYLKKNSPESIMDAGCGTGILGASLKKSLPDAELYLYDRDSLAVYFTSLNLEKNNIFEYKTANSLLMFPFCGKRFDLIVSNLPAKAGKEVLSDFIQQAPYHLTEKGIAAVVIVKPLASFAAETLRKNSLEVLETVNTANYSVFVFKYPEDVLENKVISYLRKLQTDEADSADKDTENTIKITESYTEIKTDDELFESYIRKEKQLFEIKDSGFNIDTATGLPDFDTLSFNTKLAGELITAFKKNVGTDKKRLIINPGQGLIPVLIKSLDKISGNSETETVISSNDLLQLKMTERNLNSLSPSEIRIILNSPTVFHTADSIEKGTLDTIVFFYNSVPGFKKHDLIMKRMNSLLKKDGKIFLISTASEISRFLSGSRGFVNVKGKKNKGIRAVFLKKSAEA